MGIRLGFSKEEWIYPVAILILGFSYYLSYFNYGIRLSDEGFLVDGAERVLRGQLPISDFISYTPGSYFLLALLFGLFGVNLLVSRFMEICFLLINGLLMFYIGRRLMPSRWALIPSFVLILFPGPWYKVFFAFGLLLPLIALLRFLEKKARARILTVGLTIGIALVFKLEAGFYSLVTVLMVLFLDHTFGAEGPLFDRKAILGFLKNLFFCSLPCVIIIVLFLIYYQFRSALIIFFSSLMESYGSTNVSSVIEYFGKPSFLKALTTFHLGSLQHLFFYLILFLYLYFLRRALIHLLIERRKDFPKFLSVLVMGILSLTYVYNFFGKSHLLQSAAMAYLLFGSVIQSAAKEQRTRSKVLLIVLVLLLGLYVLDNLKGRDYFLSGSISRLYSIRKEGVKPIVSSKGRIFVGKRQFNNINGLIHFFEGKEGYLLPLSYEPMVNFLTGLENPTRFTILFPASLKDPIRQKQVIEEVEKYKVKYLLIRQPMWVSQDRLGFIKYAPMLYEFILSRYRLEKTIEGYLIFSPQPL